MIKRNEKLIKKDQIDLINWYEKNKRDLPWRKFKNPYHIWISEVMLQQTTVTAVIPFYQKFIETFPTVKDLAQAPLEKVYERWAGLGYYSRARNIHKAAKLFVQTGFPQSYSELIQYPGLGPYTARAVSSLAFGEKVGVLDGNVIRVLSRKYGLSVEWWKSAARESLQLIADELAQTKKVSELNQGLMELGATLCTPKKTMCVICPWNQTCVALKKQMISELPLKKTKDEFQMWEWNFHVHLSKNKKWIHLSENSKTPFLKKNLLPESTAQKINKKPQSFDFEHGVTKYKIYIKTEVSIVSKSSKSSGQWTSLNEISQVNPTSLMKKIMKHSLERDKLKT